MATRRTGEQDTIPDSARRPAPAADASADTIASYDGETAMVSAAPPVRPGAGAARPELDPERYAVTGELARGGMGRVSIAQDRVLGRTVAIKELLDAAPELVARFHRELALTARLAHPGIVTVHDGGTWPDGAPAYVMRLVAGESLDRKLAAAPTLAGRLAHLPHVIAAADALAYAHAQGIIHRDLKPSNVMVGDFGEAVVIDWGLAKDLRATPGLPAAPPRAGHAPTPPLHAGASDAATVVGDVLGTPAYMPPEQARGEDVDERADVYALGALLYHVLTGAPPYQGAPALALASVLDGPPPSLAARAEDAPPELITIVERAMARAPRDRYATAAELSVDLKRFQAGKLVASHAYSAWELARRWARKRRPLLTAIGSAVVVAVVIGTLSVRQIVREQAETRRALALATQHKGEAQARGAETEHLVDYLVFELHARLRAVGRLDILNSVAATLSAHYAARGDATSVEERLARARARRNLGEIRGAQGDSRAALAEFLAAAALLRPAVAAAPNSSEVLSDMMFLDAFIGDAMAEQGDLDGALTHLVGALARGRPAFAAAPTDPLRAAALTELLLSLGQLQSDRRAYTVSRATLREALATARAAARLQPEQGPRRRLAQALNMLGDVERPLGDAAAAQAAYTEELAIVRELASEAPDNTTISNELQNAYADLGRLALEQGDAATALAQFGAARRVVEALVALEPANTSWLRDLSQMHVLIADALSQPETAEKAIIELREALPLRVRLAQRDPANADWQRDLLVVKTKLAMLTEAVGRSADAFTLYQEAWEIGARLLTLPGEHVQLRRDIHPLAAGLGRILLERHQPREALTWMQRAATTIEGVVAAPATVVTSADYWALVLSHQDLAGALMATGDHAGSRARLEAAYALAARRVTEDAADPDWIPKRDELAAALARLPAR